MPTFLPDLLSSAGALCSWHLLPVFAQVDSRSAPRLRNLHGGCMAGQMLGSVLTGVIGDRFGYARCRGDRDGGPHRRAGPRYLGKSAVAITWPRSRSGSSSCPTSWPATTSQWRSVPTRITPHTSASCPRSRRPSRRSWRVRGIRIDRFGFIPVATVGLAGAVGAPSSSPSGCRSRILDGGKRGRA